MNNYFPNTFLLLILVFLVSSCQQEISKKNTSYTGPLFSEVKTSQSKISFRNSVTENNQFNFLTYLYMYNGGGVSIGDINNDGLQDIYFTSNQGENKLYLNKGSLEFEDITRNAGVSDRDGWSTGTSMIDINNDGLLDIYVCKSGIPSNPLLRKNKLFINKGNNQFEERAAQYGLDHDGLSTQSYFFDYDNDGDLDMYLVNHRADFNNTIVLSAEIQKAFVPQFSDQFFRNDNNKFTNITAQAGIGNKAWGLSASIADFNDHGWLDIYVCNDFMEPDHLWINNKNGGFEDKILEYMDHISFYSMGSDVADINNDGRLDLMVLDMVSEDHVRSKQNMPGMSSIQFNTMVQQGYHHQYMANMLQLNRGNQRFSEISHLAGVSKTDWSWAPLFADFNNDGHKDLFVTNGIKRDMTDNHYKNQLKARNESGMMTLDEVFTMAPSQKVKNYVFENQKNLRFKNQTDDWGLSQKPNSNGAAYADLDNDGDLDLVVNNLEDFSSVYENHTNGNFMKFQFIGPQSNKLGIGTHIKIKTGDQEQSYQHFLNRGFQSSVGTDIVMGLDDNNKIDELQVLWPDGKVQILKDLKANQLIQLDYKNATNQNINSKKNIEYFAQLDDLPFNYKQVENVYDDFKDEILLPNKLSTQGPKIAKADVNGDGLEDVYISGAKGMAGKMFVQNQQNRFDETNQNLWQSEKRFEDIHAHFFDSDMDGDIDLYVVSGGNEKNNDLQDRLYLNDGKGNFSKTKNALPLLKQSGSIVHSYDIDGDKDLDLFVGGRVVPGKYPVPANSYILLNENGKFKNVTEELAPDLLKLGLVTDAIFSDYDQDGDKDLMIVGEWMPLTIFNNDQGRFSKSSLEETTGVGWYYSLSEYDFDQDGNQDYVLGNLGLNNKFGAKKEKPFHVFCDDFDDSGNLDIVLSKESKGKLLPVRGRECSSQQMPFIKEDFPTFKSFALADLSKIYGQEKLENALHYEATNFASLVLINQGNGNFESSKLPMEAQMGPLLQSVFHDVNNDGHMDIIGGGSIYNAEVETVRYDGSKGFVLLNDGQGNFKNHDQSGLSLDGNIKDLCLLHAGNTTQLIVVRNSDSALFFGMR